MGADIALVPLFTVSNLKMGKLSQIPLTFSQFPIFLEFTILTLCSGILTRPKVWMSEYSYSSSVESTDTFEILTFPVYPTSNLLNNSFIFQPNHSEVIVVGNLSYLVITCEANYPIYWTVSQNVNLISTPITLLALNILKPSSVSMATNSSKIFTSLMTILIDNYKGNLFPSQHGNWLFSCYGDNHSNTSITLKFGQVPQKLSTKPITLENKIGIAILTQNSPATMAAANKKYLNLGKILTNHSLNLDGNLGQLTVMGQNVSVNFADFFENWDDVDDDDLLKLTKTLVELKPNESIVEGDKIQVLCFSSNRFDYAIGSYLEVSMETDTLSKRRIAEERDENIEGWDGNLRTQVKLSENSLKLAKKLFLMDSNKDDIWLSNAHENMIFYLSEEFTLEKGINKVECFMPLWKTGEWDMVSKEINVVSK